jgi:hypothetical protein
MTIVEITGDMLRATCTRSTSRLKDLAGSATPFQANRVLAVIGSMYTFAARRLDALNHRIAAAEIQETQAHKEAQARADAAAYLTSREHMLDLQAVQRQYQARADDALQTWGERAPAPIAGESVDEYRMRLASLVQQRLPEGDEYRRLQLGGLPRTAFKNFEDAIYPRAKAAGASADSVAAGELREVVQVNPINGHKEHLFYGRESFVKDLITKSH